MKRLLVIIAALFAFSGLAFAAVDLNTADQKQLESVKGIGPAKAKDIIDYRTKHGPFKSVDDLKNVKGFGDKNVEKLKGELTVGGAAAAPAKKEEKKADKKPEPAKSAEPAKPATPAKPAEPAKPADKKY
jgi:competence protein ComEA